MTATVTIHAPGGRIVDALPVHWPPTPEESRRVQTALRLASTTRLMVATLCDCLLDRDTGALVTPCFSHSEHSK